MTADDGKVSEKKDFRIAGTAGGSDSARRADSPGETVSRISDRISPRGRTREIDDLLEAVRALPDVRHDKVAAIRKAIESGTYVVNAANVAQRMIDEIR